MLDKLLYGYDDKTTWLSRTFPGQIFVYELRAAIINTVT